MRSKRKCEARTNASWAKSRFQTVAPGRKRSAVLALKGADKEF